MFVLFVQFERMKIHKKQRKVSKKNSVAVADGNKPGSEIPEPDAFLEEAKSEPKRQLIHDHIGTIKTLRNEKRFTFRAIAEWLTKKGIETDHSAVYRAYMGAIPLDQRDPNESWEDVDMAIPD